MHRRVLSVFDHVEAKAAREASGVLYRVDQDARTGATTVLVQSASRPEWTRLPPRYLHEDAGAENPACKSVAESYATLTAGTHLRFRLRANPTRKIDTKSGADGERRNGRRVELRDEEAQLAWLRRKGEQHGFNLLAVRVADERKSTGARRVANKNGEQLISPDTTDAGTAPDHVTGEDAAAVGVRERTLRLTFASVLFDGELVITDAELFRIALASGVGTSKAYGFGLLSIARATSEEGS